MAPGDCRNSPGPRNPGDFPSDIFLTANSTVIEFCTRTKIPKPEPMRPILPLISPWIGAFFRLFLTRIVHQPRSVFLWRCGILRGFQKTRSNASFPVDFFFVWMFSWFWASSTQREIFSESYFESNQNQIVFTIFRLIWHQPEFCLALNQPYSVFV